MIELHNPKNGVCISLQTSMQKDFINNGRRYLTGELDLYSFRFQTANYNDPSRPAKIIFEWSAKDALSSTIEISKKSDFSDVFMSAVGCNRFEAYNFESGTTYYWRVRNPREESEVFSFRTEDVLPRFLYIDGTTNVRDIGGYITEDGKRIKQGLLFRGAELDMHSHITEYGKRTMRDILGVKTDMDLRGEAVGFTNESPIGDDVNLVQLRMRAYETYVKEENYENMAKVFDILADETNYPVYFHCWGGADRTGCLAFTVEAILGLDEENLMKNFELTCLSHLGNVKNRDDEDFAAMVKTLKEKGGTWRERMTGFLIECGVPAENIEKVRKIMLED